MRLKLLFTIVFINYINTFGQELNQSEWLWEINVENTAVMVGQPLGFIDKNNNHFLVGNFMGASTEVQGTTIQNSSTPATTPVADAFIAKFNENGVLLNVIHFEGTRYEVITSVEYDGENHYFITGSFNGTMQLDGTTVLENTDVSVSKTFIAKFNLNGQLVWSKTFDGFIGSGHLKYKNEHLYLAGNYAPDQFSFESTTLPQTNYTPSIIGMGKVLVAKFMANDGSLEWVSSSQYTGPYTSASSDRIGSQIKAITVDTNGSVYIAGDFFSKSVTFGNTTLTRSSNTNANLYFVKYTSNGTVDWAKTATTTASADSKIFDIAVDTANDLYLTGIAYNTTINFDGTPLQFPGNYGGFLVKYNAAGNLLWAKKGGISTNQAPNTGISTSWFSELYIDAQNNVYVGGNFYKYLNLGTGFVYDLNNERYLILAKYNTLGVVQSCEVYPYNPNSAANIKVLNSGNNFSIISTVYSNLQLNNLSFQVNQSARKYIAKRKDPAASNEEFNLDNYTVYPNPVRDLLFVDGIENLSEEAQFTIFDSNGKKISEVEKGGLLSKGISISHIASGIYFLSIYDPIGNVKQYSKFIKNK